MARHRSGATGHCLLPTLVFLMAIATRSSQAQTTLDVASFAVTITDGEVTQEGSQHSFEFNAVITLQGATAADQMGVMDRWGLTVTVGNVSSTCLASSALTLTPAQSGVAIAAGGSGTIEDVVTGNLDLSTCLCSSVDELKVTLSSPSAVYTVSGVTEATAAISCRGLLGTSLTTLTGGSSLVENANGQTVTLTVVGNSETQGRSIQGGTSYWSAEVFLAMGTVNAYTQIGTRVPATLPSAMANQGWSSGGTLTLTDISAVLDLDGLGSCDDIQLVCVSLLRNPSSSLMFTIEGGSITSCAPVSCVGVLINQVIPSFTMATMIRQGEQNDFGITVTLRADPTKASVSGSALWSASAFGNADSNCMNPKQVPATVSLTNNAADYGLDTGGQSVWPVISVSLNMMGAGCNDVMYLCLEVKKGANPTPPFSLSFSPSFAKYGALQMECEGLMVASGMLNVNSVTQLAAFAANHNVQFDATFTSAASSGGVSGRDLWDLTAFPAENANGSGRMGTVSAVTLQPSQLNMPFAGSGGILSLTGLTAVLQLEADACSTYNYLCTRLSKNSAAVPDFNMSPLVLLSCSAMLSCKNVTLMSTTASPSTGASPNGLPLYEGKGSQVIYFDATLESDVTGGSVPSGTDHWQFTISPGAVVAALTQPQKDSPLTAGTPLTITRIMATLDLTNQRCESFGQVCAEVMRSSDDTLGFELESGAAQNTGCFTPTCAGVKITALVINNGVTNFALTEGAQGHMLTFSLTATVDANFGSVRGTGQLWDIFVYLSEDQQQDLTVSSLASLTGWETQDLIAGTQGTFNNVQVSLNLDSTCAKMQFLCVELRSATGQTFKLDPASNVLKTCKPVSGCSGVVITDTAVTITSGGPVIEGVASNAPTVGVSATFAAASANVTGSNFWNVTVYGSTSELGSGDRISLQTSVTSGIPAALATVDFDPITWSIDMAGRLCSEVTHVCVQVEKSSDAPFSLIPTSSLKCAPLQCEGVVITSEDFALSSNIIYEASDMKELTATAISANAEGNGASIPDSAAMNIWELTLFLNSAANGNGTTFASASPTNPNQADRNQGVNSTKPLVFKDYTFSLTTTNLRCGAALYVCLEISESPLASKNYSITFPPSPACKEITCKGATFVSASVTAPLTTGLIENEPAHPVVLSFMAVTATDTATLQTGADFWILKVFASKTADASGERYGERNAEITTNTPLIADSTVQFLDVEETLDLNGFVCPGVRGYLCAELQRDPASLPPFTIQGSPNPLVACLEVECQGVLINNIALSGLPPAIIERGTAPVTLTATVAVGGADASGTMLWEMSASLLDGTTLLSTGAVDLGQQANNDVVNGQPITFSDVTLPFDLSRLVCPSNGTVTLCINLSRAGGSNVNFTVTGATQQCTDVPCKGVVIVQSSATATSGDLKEGRESNPVVLDLSFTSSPTGASVSGITLWSVTVFGNSEENGQGDRMSEVMATLQGNDVSFPLSNGSSVEFNSVMATLNLTPYLVCEEVRWVCAELKKQVTSSVDFSLMSKSNAHIACTNLNCQGVQITSTTLSLNNANSMFEEDSGSTALSLPQITLTSAPGSSQLQPPDNYFKVRLFGSPVAGTSQTEVAQTLVDTSNQNVQLLQGDQLIYTSVPATLNLTGVFCTDLNYLCVQVSRGVSSPFKFKLEGVPNENSLIGCSEVTCKGLRVTSGTFGVTSDLLEGVHVFSLSVHVTFNTSDTGASVRAGGSNLFRLEAFVASNATGIPDPKTPSQVVVLPSGSESQPVAAGGTIDFVNAIAMLDTTAWTCQMENFICIRLVKDPAATVNYKLEGWVDTANGIGYEDDANLLTCQPINCQGVNITDVAIQTGGRTLSFQERDGETSFTVDVAVSAAADTGSVVGTGLWNVTFALNNQTDGNGDTFETLSVAALSAENSGSGVAAGSTTNLTGVAVTMPAVADILCSLASPFYLCVKVEKADGSVPDFTIRTIDWQCVPVTCYPVIITDIQFEAFLPTYILENVDNYLHVDLYVTTDLNSADIAGTGLWNSPSFQIRDSANAVTPLNATGTYWTADEENKPLTANQTVLFKNIFPVQITPSGVLCDNLDELCLTFEKGNEPVPQFDLNFTTPNDVCIPVTCKGVEIVSTMITNITEGSPVKERSDSVLVLLSMMSVSAGDAASINGQDLWAVSFYYTPHANGDEDPTIGKETFPLSPGNINAPLIAGQNLVLTNLGTTVDLSNLVCPAGGLWLCARLQRHANPNPLFTLSAKNGDDSVFVGCQSVTCRGVELEDTFVHIMTGELIPVENVASHTISFLFEAMRSPRGATIIGTGLWQLKVFANRRADGSHHRKAYESPVALNTVQTNSPLSETALVLSFAGVTVTLNLQNTECRQTPYFCAQILKGVNPSPEFSLQGSPDDNALIACAKLDCNGVKIATFSLTGTGGNTLHENEDDQMFSFDVALTSDAGKGAISGNDLWEFKAYVNNHADCLGDAEEVALTDAVIQAGEEDQDLVNGGTINFKVDVPLDYQMNCPSWPKVYLCLEVHVGAGTSRDFTLFGEIVKGVEVQCKGVEVTNTEIREVNSGSQIVESDAEVTFDLNLRISSNADGSSISGLGLWSVDIFTSDTESCATVTSERVTSALSVSNLNRPLSAGALFLMNNVRATVPLPDALCENINYVCVEWGKGLGASPNFTLVPKPDETALIASSAIECKGLHILSTSLDLFMGDPLISNDPRHTITFDFNFQTDSSGASVIDPVNLFRLQVAATAVPGRDGVAASQHQVTVPYSPPPNNDIIAGRRYSIPVEAELNLEGARCDEIPYVCVTLTKGLNAEPRFTLTPGISDPVLTACTQRLDCRGIRIVSEQLTVNSGIPFVEHATNNPVDLIVTLTSDAVGGSATGVNLWSAEVKLSNEDPLAPGTVFRASTNGTFSGADADKDLLKGETIELNIAADLNLDGLSCSDVPYLIVVITNPNADPGFTLEWRNSSSVVVTQLFTCTGVSLSPNTLRLDSVTPLRELAATSIVTFSVSVLATPTSATVRGMDLWKTTVFLSADQNGAGTRQAEIMEAALDSLQGAVPIVAGMVSGLDGVTVTLMTANLYCRDMAYLCVEVWSGSAAQPYYNIESPNNQTGLRQCVATSCNGVQVMSVVSTIITDYPLIEQRPNQEVRLELNVTASPGSSGINGDNLWRATVFVTSQADGSGTRRSEREATISASQSGRDLNPTAVLTLENLIATMDLTGVPCAEMRYICVTLGKGAAAQPDFSLAGLPDDSSLTDCAETKCIGVAIQSSSLTLGSNELLESDSSATFMLDASFNPWSNSRSLQADRSWDLYVFASNCGDGCGVESAQVSAALTTAQQNQGVQVGTPLTFDGQVATLDLTGMNCSDTTHLCVRLATQAGTPFVLGGYPTDASLVSCVELQCYTKTVDLYTTEVTDRKISVAFTEAFGDFDLYVLKYSPADGITNSPFSIPRNLQRALDFSLLVPGQLYTIELTLMDGADTKAGPFVLEERTKPDAVTLQLDSVTSSELTVSWDAASGVFEYYTLILNPSDNGLPRTPYQVYPNQDREVTFTGLLTARSYNITIITVSGNLPSSPSTVLANTDPSRPTLTSTGRAETTIDLQWFIDRAYILDHYEVTYDPAGTSTQPLTLPSDVDRTTLVDLVPGRFYTISLVAVSNLVGNQILRSDPDTISLRTRPIAPANITHTPTETSIRVEWPSTVGEVDFYTVTFSPSVDLGETKVLKDSPRDLLFQGLEVASEYTVTITTHIENVDENLASVPIQRVFYTLPHTPGPLSIVKVTTTTIEFTWQDAAGPRDGYEVTYVPNEPEFDPQSPFFTTSNSMLLIGIQPHVTVDFEVRTKIGNVVSRPRKLRQRTFPTQPGPVRDFEVISFDSDQIRISFKAPESPNGLILAYLVSVQGTKPGEPSDSAFQTITALPNDIQFDEIISPLKAGYTYVLAIQATNTEGSSDPVYLNPITLPIKAPFFSGQQVSFADFILQVTSSSITIRIPKSLFSDKNGVVTAYTVVVVQEGANQTAVAILPSYQQIRGRAIWPVYQTSEPFNPFNTARRRRQTENDDTVDFVIGQEETCPSFGYCNGVLKPISQYRVRVRAYTENGQFTDSPWSDVIATKFDPWWFVYALIPFMIVILIIAFIMCLCTCIAGDKKKKPAKRQQRREKAMEAYPAQPNENANNIYGTTSSQERLTPDTPPPKRGPKSRPVEVVKFGQHVRKLSSKLGDNFGKEYEDLNYIGDSHAKNVGNLTENVDKNRYPNIVPFDFNRIHLDKDEDYINASSVTGFNGANEYIASQGPQDNTVNDFWQMIWEQNTPAIAVIGSPVENGRVKFVQYWPNDSTPITFGDITVNRVSEREETKHGYIVRDFCLESGSEVRALRQFNFTSWPEHGVPKSSNQMLNFVRAVRSALPNDAGPLLVHCGAGIGRTGVFIALDILTQHLSLDEKYIDVFGTVAKEREERTNMVQTVHQYEFLHRALLDILEGRVTGPNWVLKSKRRTSVDSDQIAADEIGEASL